ncbi:glycoside hydrolase family 6 protein [Streptomyces sp. ISL-12]|uniref:glycoside hydrolase family 6 protein n=1 Tax=Streptomyces sp. ISL-12 TaxID=2819177 RepID=UPI001BEB24F2|nr:glycoside hydrolase family 6 protein [Streptomyces sp. ISL-12]MBT2412256.1 glycoside hydrolase family 6 protein [Streptomyces sp. ISL-12]
MVAVAAVVTVTGTVAGTLSALEEDDAGGGRADEARPSVTRSFRPVHEHVPPSPSPSPPVSRSAPASSAPRTSPTPTPTPTKTTGEPRTAAPAARLYRHPDSQVLDWVTAHPDDPRHAVIADRIADRPAAVWFADFTPETITGRVRAVTSAGAAQGRVPVLVPYAIPDRDCGGHSEGGAPDLAAYDDWIDRFAAGLGPQEVIVILEPDSVAQAGCLSAADRADRFASLARAGRVLKEAGPRTRVYYDAGHSGWHAPGKQAGWLRQAGAASAASSDGVFSNVSNFRTTADETAYDRAVLDALGGPAHLGAVVDTSRNGNGAPADGAWCDPAGRRIGRAPTLTTGEDRIDAYLWVKLPGESDGCKGSPGTFSPSYAYDLARGESSS